MTDTALSGAGSRRRQPRRIAAITGAASGIGAAFARRLYEDGFDLLLLDLDAAGLEQLVCDMDPGRVIKVVADLTDSRTVDEVAARLADVDDLALLVNSAGYGTLVLYAEAEIERQLGMVALHVTTPMILCRAVLPRMIAQHRGAIINVASAGAYTRFPRDATYIGTKSFLIAFTECLAIELVGSSVRVQTLCPAWVRTNFTTVGDYGRLSYRSPIPPWLVLSAETVVDSSLRAIRKGSGTHVPGLRARLAIRMLGSRGGRAVLAYVRRRRQGRLPAHLSQSRLQ